MYKIARANRELDFFFKQAIPSLFSFIFGLFQTTQYKFYSK